MYEYMKAPHTHTLQPALNVMKFSLLNVLIHMAKKKRSASTIVETFTQQSTQQNKNTFHFRRKFLSVVSSGCVVVVLVVASPIFAHYMHICVTMLCPLCTVLNSNDANLKIN